MNGLKRFTLSIVVIGAFAFYAFLVRPKNSNANNPISIPIEVTPPSTATQTASPIINTPTSIPTTTSKSIYKDGTFTGSVEDAFYGNLQISVMINGGKITDVKFLQYPNDRRNSIEINTYALPILRQETIQAQSANIDMVSGATDTSQAFILSLKTAVRSAQT